MNKQEYFKTRALLEGIVKVCEAQYDAGAFGSWYLTVATKPRLRIVWDGKDGWLTVQQETDDVFAGMNVWIDLWIAKDRSNQTPERAVDELNKLVGGAA